MKHFNMKIYFAIASFAITAVACNHAQQAKQQEAPPVPVTTAKVQDSMVRYYDDYPATLTPLNEVTLTAQVSGYITGIYFKDGDLVTKGQKLYAIDQQVYNANLQQAIANQEVQETNLLKAQKDADRYHELDKHDAIAKQQLDYADAALAAAEKQVAAAKASVNAIRANVNFTIIRAPFTGTIGISKVKAGTAVVAGQTVLNTVSTNDPMAVDINVDQKEIFRFTTLKKENKNNDSTFMLAFGSDLYKVPGKIYLLDRAVDPQTGTIKVRILFPNKEGLIKPGMNGIVKVANRQTAPSIIIPYKAVTEQLGEFFVYVVNDSSKVDQRKVLPGKQLGSRVIVQDGLQTGETIVVEGTQNLHQGSAITTTPPKPATANR